MKTIPIAALAVTAFALISAPVSAADMAVKMPVKAPPPAPALVYNWTGWYVGLNAGYGWGSTSFNLTGDNRAGQRWIDGLINSNNGSFSSIATHFNDAAYNIVRVGLNYQFH